MLIEAAWLRSWSKTSFLAVRLDAIAGIQLAATRMRDELKKSLDKFGKGFASWWHTLSSQKREKMLSTVTNGTLPRKSALIDGDPNGEDLKIVRLRLMAGEMSACCVGIDTETLIGTTCGCPPSELKSCHFYSDRLLHNLYAWVEKESQVEISERQLCEMFSDCGIFPKLLGDSSIPSYMVKRQINISSLLSNLCDVYQQDVPHACNPPLRAPRRVRALSPDL